MELSHDGGIPKRLQGCSQVPNPPGAPPGLYILPEWITPQEEQEIVDFICKGQWSDHVSGKRLTQHYGYRYSIGGYKASDEKLAVDWGVLQKHSDRLQTDFPGISIVQCMVNAYRRDTGISSHRDQSQPIVFGLSLVGDINMRWTKISDRKHKYEALIPARSLYIMCNDAALDWEHEVPVLSTVRYPDPQNNNALTRVVKKPDWYIRASITYRHFNQAIGPDRLSVNQPKLTVQPSMTKGGLRYSHLNAIVPSHHENEPLLFAEIPWMTMKTRFGGDLSRQICGSAEKVSRTVGIYGVWVQLFCQKLLQVQVQILDAFANLYPTGKSALPAHRDDYQCWIFGLSFGETRTFDFVANHLKATLATSTLLKDSPNDIVSLEVKSGDVVIFAPEVNNTHKHRIMAEPKKSGRRINLTFFIQPINSGTSKQSLDGLLNLSSFGVNQIPTFQEAEQVYMQHQGTGPSQEIRRGGIEVFEEDNGALTVNLGGVNVTFNSLEELLTNLNH